MMAEEETGEEVPAEDAPAGESEEDADAMAAEWAAMAEDDDDDGLGNACDDRP